MAKWCFLCGSLCVYIVLFIRIAKGSSDNVYLYEVDGALPRAELHFQHKRDIPPEPSHPKPTELPTTTLTNPKSKSVKLQKPISSTNITKLMLKDIYTKNLGVNGTGQKKIYDSPNPLGNVPSSVQPIVTEAANPSSTTVRTVEMEAGDADEVFGDLNKTLAHNNITKTVTDPHLYYNSTFKTDVELGKHYWIDMKNISGVIVNPLLSNSHRRAASVKLSFDFPFYGHPIKTVTIATGGFLYTGDYVHSWLAATQYIAPLMSNFDTSLSNDSYIKYVDNGTAFTVEWEKVLLQDQPNAGEFTFQVTLFKSGDIVFVYKNVPVIIKNIDDIYHPVKVGLSDAYIMDRTIFFVRRKTIYEYHRVKFDKEDIVNGTVIYLKALPTCLDNKECHTCLSRKLPGFECTWCPNLERCSNGYDRHRQDWVIKGCDKRKIMNESSCRLIPSDPYNSYSHHMNDYENLDDANKASVITNKASAGQEPVKMGVSGIVAILFLMAMISGLALWIVYAYKYPHTASGQILIRYRPSQWRWRRGEARYTAATIHM